MVLTPSKTVDQTSPDGMGKAPPPDGMGKACTFTVWAEPTWSPLWGWLSLAQPGWVNKDTYNNINMVYMRYSPSEDHA